MHYRSSCVPSSCPAFRTRNDSKSWLTFFNNTQAAFVHKPCIFHSLVFSKCMILSVAYRDTSDVSLTRANWWTRRNSRQLATTCLQERDAQKFEPWQMIFFQVPRSDRVISGHGVPQKMQESFYIFSFQDGCVTMSRCWILYFGMCSPSFASHCLIRRILYWFFIVSLISIFQTWQSKIQSTRPS